MIDSRFGPEIREDILERLEDGDSLFTICGDARMPNRSTVQRWADDDAEFAAAIARARDIGFDRRADRAVAAAKAATDAATGRLAFDAERWYLSKLHPKRYGEKVDLTSGNEPLRNLSDEALDARIAAKLKTLG